MVCIITRGGAAAFNIITIVRLHITLLQYITREGYYYKFILILKFQASYQFKYAMTKEEF